MLAAIERTSMPSLQRRFFVPKKVLRAGNGYFLNIDFDKHVSLIAEINEDEHSVSPAASATSWYSQAKPK